jgi:hypothetical protein
MLSRCANPECSEKFLFLHLGKLFCLAPTPEIEVSESALSPLRERFWLCDHCAKIMTIIWDGTKATLTPLPPAPAQGTKPQPAATVAPSTLQRAAHAGIEKA